MSRVSHPNIDPQTMNYIGPALAQWSDRAQLSTARQMIHEDFKANPPIPLSIQSPG